MLKVAILQSNYIPWKGTFDLINKVDTFVFFDDVQYTKRDWRNRNIIMTLNGPHWISVPVKMKESHYQMIKDVSIDINQNWQEKHYKSFQMNYGKANYYKNYKWILEDIYLTKQWANLSELNMYFIKLISKELGIKTQFIKSTDLNIEGKKDDRLIDICKKLNADYYLSGPAAKNYIIPSKFQNENIILDYIEYVYPQYNQLHKPFNHYVTILDLIFNCGPDAAYFIWGWREDKGEIKYDFLQ